MNGWLHVILDIVRIVGIYIAGPVLVNRKLDRLTRRVEQLERAVARDTRETVRACGLIAQAVIPPPADTGHIGGG